MRQAYAAKASKMMHSGWGSGAVAQIDATMPARDVSSGSGHAPRSARSETGGKQQKWRAGHTEKWSLPGRPESERCVPAVPPRRDESRARCVRERGGASAGGPGVHPGSTRISTRWSRNTWMRAAAIDGSSLQSKGVEASHHEGTQEYAHLAELGRDSALLAPAPAGSRGGNYGYWPHVPRAGYYRLLGVVCAPPMIAWQDSAACHPAGEQSLDQKSDCVFRAGLALPVHTPLWGQEC